MCWTRGGFAGPPIALRLTLRKRVDACRTEVSERTPSASTQDSDRHRPPHATHDRLTAIRLVDAKTEEHHPRTEPVCRPTNVLLVAYATLVAQQDASRRAADDIRDRIRIDLASFFAQKRKDIVKSSRPTTTGGIRGAARRRSDLRADSGLIPRARETVLKTVSTILAIRSASPISTSRTLSGDPARLFDERRRSPCWADGACTRARRLQRAADYSNLSFRIRKATPGGLEGGDLPSAR